MRAWLCSGVRCGGHCPGGSWHQEASAALQVELPGFAIQRAHAMGVLDEREEQQAALQVGNDSAGLRGLLALAKRGGIGSGRSRAPAASGATRPAAGR